MLKPWRRLTHALGLELTILLAVALVGALVFGAGAWLVGHHRSFAGDATAFEAARGLRGSTAIDVIKGLTWAGSLPVMAGATGLASLYLGRRRRWAEVGALIAGAALTVVAVHVAKAVTDRPRPSGALVGTSGRSFPSGHAAYAIAFVAIAIALGRGRPGLRYRAAFVAAAVLLAGAVGLSRVYLRAHYLSDVVGGWALAATLFALSAMVALVVAFFGHNGSTRDVVSS